MDSITVVADSWAAQDIGRANSFRDRWRGLKGNQHCRGLLIATRSVHGFGLRSPVRAVGITSGMTVSSVRLLRRWRVLFFPEAKFVLELPLDAGAPSVGSQVEMRRG